MVFIIFKFLFFDIFIFILKSEMKIGFSFVDFSAFRNITNHVSLNAFRKILEQILNFIRQRVSLTLKFESSLNRFHNRQFKISFIMISLIFKYRWKALILKRIKRIAGRFIIVYILVIPNLKICVFSFL